MKIYISGLYSGTNPQPGVGIARSLRDAYPHAKLIGVEYSNRCSGIHWRDFDEIWLNRSWEELDLDSHKEEIQRLLETGGFYISANDLEAIWLAHVFPFGHANLLTPPAKALRDVAKPAVTAHSRLPVKIPTFVTTEISDWDLHAFCRQHNWKVWLKGPYYEAVRIRSWSEFQEMRAVLSNAWSTEKLFLQAHVTGYEESISLSAYKGKLLSCVRMRKRDLTEMSKTWAGQITQVPREVLEPLRDTIRDLNWTGGAELEMVRDADEQLWLLEVNPRYPAWIHGATITGFNLPARLVEAASGILAKENLATGEEFTRVVLEIPVRSEYPLPALVEPFAGGIGHSLKHPSGLLGFANRLHDKGIIDGGTIDEDGDANVYEFDPEQSGSGNGNGDGTDSGNSTGRGSSVGTAPGGRLLRSIVAKKEPRAEKMDTSPQIPHSFVEDISRVDFEQIQTPSFLFLEKTAKDLFERAAAAARGLSTDKVLFSNAYSIKTNPDERLIKLAYDAGFLAEAISLLEVKKAIDLGFNASQIVLNGPAKWWHPELIPSEPFHAVFCDSISDLTRVVSLLTNGELKAKTVGVRLRTPNIPSRFGIPIDTPKVFKALLDAVEMLPSGCDFGIHFHMASSNVGVEQWWHLFESMLRWCASVEVLSGRSISVLDIGGGWFPDDWHDNNYANDARTMSRVHEFLPHVKQIICEPGKALAQPSMALAMRILEVQDFPDVATDVVVDASIAELPMSFFYPHRILHQSAKTGAWRSVGRGKSHLLGRLCMEHDVIASNIGLPKEAESGDLIVFCDAGAYDRSMSYVFGRG